MTPEERKLQSEAILRKRNIRINDWLPLSEAEDEIALRDGVEIGKRIIILIYLLYSGQTDDRDQPVSFLKEMGLWESVTVAERNLFSRREWSEQETINISWKSECVHVLLWSVGKISSLEFPVSECPINVLLEKVPPFLTDPSEFISECEPRSAAEILDAADFIYRLHWAVREAHHTDKNFPPDTDPGVVYERHYAINWLIQTDEESFDWDDVATDT